MQFIKNEIHIVISKFTYDVPDAEIVSRFGSTERFKEILEHLAEDNWGSGGGDPPSDEETDALNDFLAEFGAADRDDYWLTEDKGGAEVSYELDGDQ